MSAHKENIYFIVNPVSGKGRNEISPKEISKHVNLDKYNVFIAYSEYPNHIPILTKEAIKKGASIIFACGGDGTINEVATNLVDTNIVLGIMPIGSGNGLAKTLNVPKKIKPICEMINNRKVISIDVGVVNNGYFFCNFGLGFVAQVIHKYSETKHRRFYGYFKAVLATYKYRNTFNVDLKVNGIDHLVSTAFLLVSNTNTLGYNVSLTPRASCRDGVLDLVILPACSKIKSLWALLLFLLKIPPKGIIYKRITKTKITLNQSNNLAQKDGEKLSGVSKDIEISVLREALNVLVT